MVQALLMALLLFRFAKKSWVLIVDNLRNLFLTPTAKCSGSSKVARSARDKISLPPEWRSALKFAHRIDRRTNRGDALGFAREFVPIEEHSCHSIGIDRRNCQCRRGYRSRSQR